MKMTGVMVLTSFLFISSFSPAQTDEASQAYIKAMTAQTPAQQAQLLKEFIAKYGGKGTQYENFAYANLSILNYPGKTPKESIEYGEKALVLGGLDDSTKCNVLIIVSGIYSQLGQNLEKARSYALQVVDLAKANKTKESTTTTSAQWNQIMGAGYYAHGQALEKAKDLRGAVDSYVNSYNLLKNPQIAADLKKLGKSLYDFKFYNDAEKAFKVASAVLKDYESLSFYAKTLHRNGKNEEALACYKETYATQRSGEVAYNIGLILAKKAETNPSFSAEAIRYMLEASFLSPSKSHQAMQIAESLFFAANKDLRYNETVTEITEKNKKIEELTQTYNSKFEGKNEEELSEAEKKEMKSLLKSIEAEKKILEKLEATQNANIAKFTKLLEETKQRLGIK